MAFATLIREVNKGGVWRVAESIRFKGWLPRAPPRIIVCKDVCKGAVLSSAEAETVTYRVLNGNHRLSTHREVFGPDGALRWGVYQSFQSPGISKAIADCE